MIRKILLCFCVIIAICSCNNNERVDGRNPRDRKENLKVDELIEGKNETPIGETNMQKKPVVNVYIENSGSMDGFVNGLTQFKDAIGKMLVDLKYYYGDKNVHVYYIGNDRNEQLCVKNAFETDIADFANSIDLSWRRASRDEQGQRLRGNNTNLNNIFKRILEDTQDSTLTVLFSDCIYSIGEGETVNMLDFEKRMTYDAFLTKSKQNKDKDLEELSTTIVKMWSKFDGEYYPFTGDRNHFHVNNNLAYYICVIGNQDILSDFNNNIELNKLHGYENKYVISKGASDNLYYSILTTTEKNGEFKTRRDCSTREYIHGIESVRAPRNGLFSFAIAVNMHNIDVEDDYKMDAKNYVISEDNLVIKKIIPIAKNNINQTDWTKIRSGNPSHIIVVEATRMSFSDFSIEFKKQMPGWIEDSNIMDDTDANYLLGGKSFGLKYWIEGIAEAYEKIYPEEKDYYKIDIKIKR